MRILKSIFLLVLFSTIILGAGLFFWISQPPNLGRLNEVSQVLRASNNTILNLRLTQDGFWREKANLEEIDPQLVAMLIAYEDQKFWSHKGVDPQAIIRATYDFITSGRIVSGASTLTMQTARLIDPSLSQKTISTKIWQMLEAIRLEHHWTKEEILEAYFTLAPYGGNIEGVHAATEAWFQKSAQQLTLNESALLVALPQSPERRRPDRFAKNAFLAKQKVLMQVKERMALNDDLVLEVLNEPLPFRLSKPTSIAPHLADRFISQPNKSIKTTIDVNWQKEVADILAAETSKLPTPIQSAAMVIERKSGTVRAYVGSAKYGTIERKGSINYLTAIRSPGSTLKPLIFGKALQRNLISFNHVFEDASFFRGGYTPTNFDGSFSGEVTLKEALLRSLNIPALLALEKVGPDILENEIKSYLGGTFHKQKDAGLSLALGGLYMEPEQLAEIYLAIFDPGYATKLQLIEKSAANKDQQSYTFLNQHSADQVLNLLIQTLPNGENVAFKTGTSYARQDAWSVQIFENHIVLSWLGTPDNEATNMLTGRNSAFPISNEIGRALGLPPPQKPEIKAKFDELNLATKLTCKRLINFPEEGSWIRSSNSVVTVTGSEDAVWYLNAQKLGAFERQLKVSQAGTNTLTAKLGKCFETVEFFMEQ
ncbi:penicillin-binding protein 1C [Ascidiaceihabitans sp.]|nr:penicillin-binding protein 1C [Ascidiaceihabitans sp.]